MSASQRQAIKLFRDFNSREPEYLDKVEIPVYDTLMYIGPCTRINYLADNGYEYSHAFRRQSRADLCVTADGSNLVLVGGRYRFTERGIVDK